MAPRDLTPVLCTRGLCFGIWQVGQLWEGALGCSDARCRNAQASLDLSLIITPVPHNHRRPPAQIRLDIPC